MGCDREAKSTAKRTRGGYGRHERTEADAVQRGHEEACPWDTGTAETEERTYQPQATPAYRASKRLTPASDTSEIQRAYERASDTSERAIRASERAGDRMQHAGEVMAG